VTLWVSRVISTPSDRVGSYPNDDHTRGPPQRSKGVIGEIGQAVRLSGT
jgi:hypothetical protein